MSNTKKRSGLLAEVMVASPEPTIRMAKSISAVVCEHGNLYVRLHDANGLIFAAACMDRATGFRLVDSITSEFSEPSAECGGVH